MRRVVAASFFGLSALGLLACPPTGLPKGPAPQYEEPPKPSWLDAGAGEAGTAPTGPVGTTVIEPS